MQPPNSLDSSTLLFHAPSSSYASTLLVPSPIRARTNQTAKVLTCPPPPPRRAGVPRGVSMTPLTRIRLLHCLIPHVFTTSDLVPKLADSNLPIGRSFRSDLARKSENREHVGTNDDDGTESESDQRAELAKERNLIRIFR
ncbi:hypothetical protein L1987_05169 [Smallanthus sonchifolius]|uniref:Uncharacterized protein n=1 Tax=Smallanthus sonchifolius TaxID=185202 RepID=A0ACB9JUY3_9ASTR|nr:hypothetical protein L1987_05169 [Smallanthus sonchifolius]